MIDRIYIPTIGRCDKQITWQNLPQKYKNITTLVVNFEDKEKYDKPTLLLPKGIKGIASIREWVVKQAKEEKICMLDDDLNFVYTKKNR